MKCMCAQTRPRFILSSERVFWGMEFEPMLTPREKSPLPETHLGLECQDIWSLCDVAQTGCQSILSSERVVGNEVRTHVNSKGKFPLPENCV